MADFELKLGSSVPIGTTFLYRDIGSGRHALVTAIETPAGAPLFVELTDSEAHIGQVGGRIATASQTPTITAAGAYAAGQAVGGLLTFANMARNAGGSGILTNVLIVDDAGQDADLELWLFNQTFTAMADQAAWNPSEADLENWIGTIRVLESLAGWLDATTQHVVQVDQILSYNLVGTSLFGQLVTRLSTPTYAAVDDITVKVVATLD